MANPTLVQQAHNSGVSVSSVAVAVSSTVAGHLLIAFVTSGDAVSSISGGGTWTKVKDNFDNASSRKVEIWACPNCSSGVTSITVNLGSSAVVAAIVTEWNNTRTDLVIDVTAKDNGTNSTPDSGAATNGNANGIAVAVAGFPATGTAGGTSGTATGWTDLVVASATLVSMIAGYRVITAAASQQQTWTAGSSVDWNGALAIITFGSIAATRTTTEAPTIAQSVARTGSFLRTATGAPVTSEAAARVAAEARTATDAPTTAESVARTAVLLRTDTDAPVLADVVTRTGGFLRTATGAPVLADVISTFKTKTAAVAESPTTAESAARVFTGSRAPTDAPTLADVGSRTGGFLRTVAGAPVLSDAASQIRNIVRSSTDAPSLAESIARLLGLSRTTTDAPATSDAVTKAIAALRATTDAPTTSESLARTAALLRAPTDAPTLADAAARSVGLSRTATDAPSIAQSVARILTLQRSATAAPSVALTAQPGLIVHRTATEAVHVGESLTVPPIRRRLRAIQYHVLILSPDTNGGPGAPKLELDADVLNLVWQQNLNLAGAAAFAMTRWNPKLSLINWMQDHIQIIRETSIGQTVVFAGKLTKPAYSATDVLCYAQDYLSFLQLSRTGYKTPYASVNLGSVIGAEWAAAQAVGNSPFAFVSTGTIQNPVGQDGTTVLTTNAQFGVTDFDRLFTFYTIAQMAMANTTNNVKFEITRSAPFTFNLWKNYGSRSAKYALTHPGNLVDYAYDPGFDQYRNDLATALQDATGGTSEYSVQTADVSTSAYRRLQAATAIRAMVGLSGATTETDQAKQMLAYQLQVLTRVPRTVTVYPRQGEVEFFDGWDVGDKMWSILQKADRTAGDEYAGDLRIIGASVAYNPYHGELPVLYGRGTP